MITATTTGIMTTMDEALKRTAALLGLLGHAKRLEVLLLLREEPLSAGELAKRLELEQSAMSHQLRLLRDARLVSSDRQGRRVLYRLADHHVAHIIGDALAHVSED